MNTIDIAVVGCGVVAPAERTLPGIDEASVLRGTDDEALKSHIARRGIRYKDRATRLALAAARVAMLEAGLGGAAGYEDLDDSRCAVVVACCFGNTDTVLRCAAQIRDEGSAALSPMDLPNASANVVPATLAIWFGLRGANLLCAGDRTSGHDALMFASNLIRTGRADRVLVCGVEAGQPALAPLFDGAGQAAPADIAAALVLERVDHYRDRRGADASCLLSVSCSSAAGAPFASLALQLAGAPESAVQCGHASTAFPGAYGAEGVLAMIAARDALRPHGTRVERGAA
jgi:3-oxoacyl-[acyl-carrier-protein] synthase II